MIQGRRETTPSQQLLELRQARDRYAALAEQTDDQAPEISDEDLERQRDARRILLAYEKSIANMTARMDRQAEFPAPTNVGTRFKLAAAIVSVALIGGAAYYVLAGYMLVRPVAHWLRFPSVQASQTAKPASGAMPTAMAGPRSKLPKETAQTGNMSMGSLGHAISPLPIPIARPHHQARTVKPADLQRPAEQVQPSQSPIRARPIAAAQTNTPNQQKNGFVAKVIQPDGSFKEEFFSSAPSR
jgi:hypothetical protein